MAKRKSGLGRGLSALIPGGPQEATQPTGLPVLPPTDIPAAPSRSDQRASEGAEDEEIARPHIPSLKGLVGTQGGAQRPADIFFGTGGAHPRGGSAADLLLPRAEGKKDSAVRLQESLGEGEQPEAHMGNVAAPAAPSASAKGSTPQDADEVELVPVPGAELHELSPLQIHPNQRQPRHVFNQAELKELADSITEVGLLQPVVVRPDPQEAGKYELIMGERRWRASQLAGLETIPAIVKAVADDDLLRDALLENLHRVQLNPLEEAAAYQQLLEDFGCSQTELSSRIARSRPQIANTIRLLKLPASVQALLADGELSAGHARALLGLENQLEQHKLARRVVEQGMSVRAVEQAVALINSQAERDAAHEAAKEAISKLREQYASTADAWARKLDTKVKIQPGLRSSKLVIEFNDPEDLERITKLLGN